MQFIIITLNFMHLLWWDWKKWREILELIKDLQQTISKNKVIFTKSKNSTLRTIKLENNQESNPKMMFLQAFS